MSQIQQTQRRNSSASAASKASQASQESKRSQQAREHSRDTAAHASDPADRSADDKKKMAASTRMQDNKLTDLSQLPEDEAGSKAGGEDGGGKKLGGAKGAGGSSGAGGGCGGGKGASGSEAVQGANAAAAAGSDEGIEGLLSQLMEYLKSFLAKLQGEDPKTKTGTPSANPTTPVDQAAPTQPEQAAAV